MFSTLLGPLPSDHGDPLEAGAAFGAADALDAVAALEAAGLDLVTDGGPPARPSDDPASVVTRWQNAAAASGVAVKQTIAGPWSASRSGFAGSPAEAAERLAAIVVALAAAGCPIVEVVEDDAAVIATDRTAAATFVDAHGRLLADVSGVHMSLALTVANVDRAGPETFFDLPYASYAFDLIAGPDNWRLIVEAPADRGIICAGIGLGEKDEATREVLVWAAHYAASTKGRGLARVGLANAPLAVGASSAPSRAAMLGRLAIVAEAARIASVESADELASMLDPRAVDPRSAALGRYAPDRRRGRP